MLNCCFKVGSPASRLAAAQPKKKKKARNTFLQYDLKKAEQFALVDAMQYVSHTFA
jgi:hypothetical protein